MLFGTAQQHLKTLLVLLAMLAVQGCESSAPSATTNPPGESAAGAQQNLSGKLVVSLTADAEKDAGVTISQSGQREIETDVNVTGEVLANANTQTHVTTPVTGRVVKILVSIGDHVKTGKELMIIRSADIEQAESDLLQGEQQVRSDLKQALVQIDCDTATADAQLKLDEKSYNRLKGLYEEKIASQADFQAAETLYFKDKIALESLVKKRKATVDLSTEKMKLVTGPAKTQTATAWCDGCRDRRSDENSGCRSHGYG